MIYSPREDSYLIAEQVKVFAKNMRVLDVGTGSGILAKTAISSKAREVTASDINLESVRHVKKMKIRTIHSNLLEKINGKFDIIIFNPPYLPLDEREDAQSRLATTGGKKGDEIILKFLKQAKKHLNDDGKILLLLSSLTPRTRINTLLKRLSLKPNILSEKNLFFEKLEVLKIENTR